MSKQSFFERLTGATKEEIFQSGPEKKTGSSKKIRLEKAQPIKKEKSPVKPTARTEDSLNKKTTPEWSSGEEGQLTIDVYQTESDIIIKSTIAGVSSEDVDVSITNEMVTIKGIRRKDEDVPQEKYYYQELYWGPFSRSIILPMDINADKARASIKNGILTIRLPKVEKLKIKTIKVKEVE